MPADLTLARELVALPGWQWMPGMLAVSLSPGPGQRLSDAGWTGTWSQRCRDAVPPPVPEWISQPEDAAWYPAEPGGWWPDLDDPATGGVLLDLLGPGWSAHRSSTAWTVRGPGPRGYSYAASEPTLGRACARALVARGWVVHRPE